jgi:hypothetical protein
MYMVFSGQFFNVFEALLYQCGRWLFDMGNEGNDESGSKTLNCCCSLKEKDGVMICTGSQQH